MISVYDCLTVYAILGNGWLCFETGTMPVWNNCTQGLHLWKRFSSKH